MPFDYTIYGLGVQSELELPELCAREAVGPVDVMIRYGGVPLQRRDPEMTIWVENRASPARARCGFESVGCFEVREGNTILVDPKPGADPALVRHVLLGPVLAYVLWQRGFFALHASVLRVEGRYLGFVGESGQGKSTTAIALARSGSALVCDDIAAIAWRESPIRVLPAFPRIRLYPDTVRGVGEDPDQLPHVHSLIDKRLVTAPEFIDHPVALDRIYVLETDGDFRLERLSARAALMQMIRHSYSVQYQALVLGVGRHMEMAAGVARGVAVYRLFRPKDLNRLPDLVRFIQDVSRQGD